MLRKQKQRKVASIFNTVNWIRQYRKGLIENIEQYEFTFRYIDLIKSNSALSFRDITPEQLKDSVDSNVRDLQTNFTSTELNFVAQTYVKISKKGISLFWQEKLLLLIRINQLYALYMLFYLEFFPERARPVFTPALMAQLGAWHLLTEDMYYKFI